MIGGLPIPRIQLVGNWKRAHRMLSMLAIAFWSAFFTWVAKLSDEEIKEYLSLLPIPRDYLPVFALFTVGVLRMVAQKSVSTETKTPNGDEEKSPSA